MKELPNDSTKSPKKTCKKHGELSIKQMQIRGNRIRCRKCMSIQARKYEKTHPEQIKKMRHNLYKKNSKIYSQKNILRKRKLTESQYKEMFEKQNYKCAICHKEGTLISKKTKTKFSLCIDHCHKTGRIRKLLCHPCNTLIGMSYESILILENAIKYLQEFSNER